MESTYYQNLNALGDAEFQETDPLIEEFEDTGDPVKPFRTEWAMESITESNSRFKRRNSDG